MHSPLEPDVSDETPVKNAMPCLPSYVSPLEMTCARSLLVVATRQF